MKLHQRVRDLGRSRPVPLRKSDVELLRHGQHELARDRRHLAPGVDLVEKPEAQSSADQTQHPVSSRIDQLLDELVELTRVVGGAVRRVAEAGEECLQRLDLLAPLARSRAGRRSTPGV